MYHYYLNFFFVLQFYTNNTSLIRYETPRTIQDLAIYQIHIIIVVVIIILGTRNSDQSLYIGAGQLESGPNTSTPHNSTRVRLNNVSHHEQRLSVYVDMYISAVVAGDDVLVTN